MFCRDTGKAFRIGVKTGTLAVPWLTVLHLMHDCCQRGVNFPTSGKEKNYEGCLPSNPPNGKGDC